MRTINLFDLTIPPKRQYLLQLNKPELAKKYKDHCVNNLMHQVVVWMTGQQQVVRQNSQGLHRGDNGIHI